MTELIRTVEDGRYSLTGQAGNLTYEPPAPGTATSEPGLSSDDHD